MRFEIIGDDNYRIFINDAYIDESDISNKEGLGKYIKNVIIKVKKIYNITLEGLYEVDVYIIKYIGIILNIKNIDSYFSKTVDLKIIVHNGEEIYLQIDHYDLIDKYRDMKYLNNNFYLNLNQINERDIYKLIENSKIIYGDELEKVKSEWHHLYNNT